MQKELCQGLKEEVMASNNFDETMAALFKGMDGFITSKTVVGDAIKFEDGTTILPLVDVSFGSEDLAKHPSCYLIDCPEQRKTSDLLHQSQFFYMFP